MAQRPVIVDCDPGQDDAVALLMALASPESLKVLGITCVAGNVPLELTQRNARRIRSLNARSKEQMRADVAGTITDVQWEWHKLHHEAESYVPRLIP